MMFAIVAVISAISGLAADFVSGVGAERTRSADVMLNDMMRSHAIAQARQGRR
jgi:hypothetical protein